MAKVARTLVPLTLHSHVPWLPFTSTRLTATGSVQLVVLPTEGAINHRDDGFKHFSGVPSALVSTGAKRNATLPVPPPPYVPRKVQEHAIVARSPSARRPLMMDLLGRWIHHNTTLVLGDPVSQHSPLLANTSRVSSYRRILAGLQSHVLEVPTMALS